MQEAGQLLWAELEAARAAKAGAELRAQEAESQCQARGAELEQLRQVGGATERGGVIDQWAGLWRGAELPSKGRGYEPMGRSKGQWAGLWTNGRGYGAMGGAMCQWAGLWTNAWG